MITMYERTIWYSKVYSSMHDHIIKFWLQSQVFGSDKSSSKHNEKHYDTQEKNWKFMKT